MSYLSEATLLDRIQQGDKTAYSFVFTTFYGDLVNSKTSTEGTVTGGGICEIRCPEDYPGRVNFKDWILHIKEIY